MTTPIHMSRAKKQRKLMKDKEIKRTLAECNRRADSKKRAEACHSVRLLRVMQMANMGHGGFGLIGSKSPTET